jgi:AN1-type zinc finger protein 5/6
MDENKNNKKDTEKTIKKKKTIRCSFCNKKCTLINYNCQCGGIFCQNHRLTHSHSCPCIEKKKIINKELLKKNNIQIIPEKVNKI